MPITHPARRKRPPQVGTIGSTIATGLKMWISCDAIGCRNNADVDLLALRDQLGADYRIADFVARSRCSKCGARWPQLSVRVSPIHTGAGCYECNAISDS
jgi:hypothetical protein